MTDHLNEIEDAAARDGVSAYQTQMEIIVLSLLEDDRGLALIQIREARVASLDHIRNTGPAIFSIGHDAKAERIATAMLEHSFGRLRLVIESADDDKPRGGKAN